MSVPTQDTKFISKCMKPRIGMTLVLRWGDNVDNYLIDLHICSHDKVISIMLSPLTIAVFTVSGSVGFMFSISNYCFTGSLHSRFPADLSVEPIVFRSVSFLKHILKEAVVQFPCSVQGYNSRLVKVIRWFLIQTEFHSTGMSGFMGPLYLTASSSKSIGFFICSLVSLAMVTSSDNVARWDCVTIIARLWQSNRQFWEWMTASKTTHRCISHHGLRKSWRQVWHYRHFGNWISRR